MPTPRKEKQEKAAIRLLKKGYTAADAARHKSVQVHPTTVQRWAEKHGIELQYPYNRHVSRTDLVDKEEIIRLRRRRSAGRYLFTVQEIAEMVACSYSYVKQVLAAARSEGRL